MKNILIAGAGTGGLAVGALLAKDGYNVTLYADCAPDTHGYNWEDSLNVRLIEEFTGVVLQEHEKGVLPNNRYFSPDEKTPIETDYGEKPPTKMERRLLSRLLIEYAASCGVQFVWHTKITGAVTENARVVGVTTDSAVLYADLVIDACGVDSAVRKVCLPSVRSNRITQRARCSMPTAVFTTSVSPPKRTPIRMRSISCIAENRAFRG